MAPTLCYQPSQRLLRWRAAPVKFLALRGPVDVALVARQIPDDDYGNSLAHPLGTGSVLKTLG
ncbi:hypothetical protein E4631_21470 [Hymenobacter sp. UV11]|uniref:hypothetical protein n=1 Tax=Hymenobacter sp. UV11 TaxID=1849735 RepID=UPI00105D3617|nr:hypothetical protein [Hymenobacter sp. UV11]TFZ63856.1 hypothetical protein E4631_21470 [Hymenobacter sp. UV11]